MLQQPSCGTLSAAVRQNGFVLDIREWGSAGLLALSNSEIPAGPLVINRVDCRQTIAPCHQILYTKMQAGLFYNTIHKLTNSLEAEMTATGYFDYTTVRSLHRILKPSARPSQKWSESDWNDGHGGARHYGASPDT